MSWRFRIGACVLSCVLAAGLGIARAEDPGKAVLLVAAPTVQGPYGQTTLIAVPAKGRHFGFILNRATEIRLSKLFPTHAPSAKVLEPVYFGGPEMNDSLFAVVAGDPGEQSLPLFGDLFVTNRASAIDRIIEQTPNDARYFVGFVVWQPGELEKEIAGGHWYVAEPQKALVFSRDTSSMWSELVKQIRISHPPRPGPGQLEARLDGARLR